jgi:lipoprotein-releasing system ATP-binding protein
MAIIEAKNINKSFYDPIELAILKNINFTIENGEFVSIMGKSGCGKSTLLYILSTMDTSYNGELYLKGEKLSDKTPDQLAYVRNKHIGFVFQFHYLLPEFTVLQNVMLPGLKLSEKSKEEVEHDAMENLKLLGMEDQALKLATRISGGQKQRVAIARSLINNPDIIMGDEPTGNLDSKNANIVFDIFKELTQEGHHSMLIVTHDHDFANKTDRIIEMADGMIVNKNGERSKK